MPAMSQFNFEEQTSGSQKKKKGVSFQEHGHLLHSGTADANGSHSCGAVQSSLPHAGGGKWASVAGQRRTERMRPLLTQWALFVHHSCASAGGRLRALCASKM